MDINNSQLITHLRRALHHLYDLDELRRNPLIELFGIAGYVDSASRLQKILLDSIDALRPNDDDLPQSKGWDIYDVLFYRYVRGYSRQSVANQLGISDRQLSRKQCTALETLANELWKNYGGDIYRDDPANDDVAWVESLPPEKNSDWKPVLRAVLDMLQPLAQQYGTKIYHSPDNSEKDLLVPQLMFRYTLLNILGRIIPLALDSLWIQAAASDSGLTITITLKPPQETKSALPDILLSDQNIEVARQFIEKARGKLDITAVGDAIQIKFTIPPCELIPVLVIDDNADIIQLFQRYAQGSPYSIIGVQNPAQALELISKIHPWIIIIDVMMPNQDGWDLLSRLRQEYQIDGQQHPWRIVVCSILPQETLALSFGANGFLQKPVLPQDFLRMLDEQVFYLSQERGKDETFISQEHR